MDLRIALALALTLGTGAVDAVSYFSLEHVFTANMSGNMALLGIGVATNLHDVLGNVYAFAGFVVGSLVVGRLMRWPRVSRPMRTALIVEVVLLAALVATLASVDVLEHSTWRYAVCVVLATAMGVQTGVARRLGVQDVNTTVATMTLHDLSAASRLAGGDSVRWRRRAGVVAALFVGAAIGVGLDRQVRWGGLAFSFLVVLVVLVVLARARVDLEE